MDGTEGESAQNARDFAQKLSEKISAAVHLQDERCTTMVAHTYLNDTNVRGKKRKAVVDAVAATIILQDYLSAHS
jgi:putative Holliday junction resolvase